jgi:hypothetical protein
MDELKPKLSDYTPDELMELYETNPNLFDELADDAIEEACIGSTPEQTLKGRQMQWTIDAHLRKGKTPLERMQIMEGIFYGQVYGEGGQLDQLMSSCKEFIGAVTGADHISDKKYKIHLLKK